jgi:hypothetical protein
MSWKFWGSVYTYLLSLRGATVPIFNPLVCLEKNLFPVAKFIVPDWRRVVVPARQPM